MEEEFLFSALRRVVRGPVLRIGDAHGARLGDRRLSACGHRCFAQLRSKSPEERGAVSATKPAPEVLALDSLGDGSFPAFTPARGQSSVQAAAVCLEHNRLSPGCTFYLIGDEVVTFAIHWTRATEQARTSWADLQEATEHGGYAIAAVVVQHVFKLLVVERSAKGTGFDYWLGVAGTEPLFQTTVGRLEVSGILAGDLAEIDKRTKAKKKQTHQSDSLSIPAYVAVIEFSRPQCCMVKRS
jgi:hypothetical protein